MKARTVLLAFFLLCLASSLPSQANRRKATVSTTEQLLKSIGPDMEIVLKPGIYALESGRRISGRYVEWRTGGGGEELVIKGVKNLILRGQDTEAASSIRTKDDGAFVLSIESSSGVSIESINFGHDVPGPCQAGVVFLSRCSGVSFKDCLLSGSGWVGVQAEDCSGLSFENTTIADCSSGGIDFAGVETAAFSGCLFDGNQAYPLIASSGSSDIEFRGCSFSGNEGDAVAGGESGGGERLRFIACAFSDNAIADLSADDPEPYIENCQFEGNDFGYPDEDGIEEGFEDPGVSGAGPRYYVHDRSGLAFQYPNYLELEEDGEMVGVIDDENLVVAVFMPLCDIPNGADAAKNPSKAFAPALDALSLVIQEQETDSSVKAQAKGEAQGLDYLPYRDYVGTVGFAESTLPFRMRVFACSGKLWAMVLMAEESALIAEGTDADFVLESVDYAPRGE